MVASGVIVSGVSKSSGKAAAMSKSLGSCAGVTFSMPVPKSRSTAVLCSIGISTPDRGMATVRPVRPANRSSSGWHTRHTSPNIVSGRVVATITPSAVPPAHGYRM
jgi:hypothetical protein